MSTIAASVIPRSRMPSSIAPSGTSTAMLTCSSRSTPRPRRGEVAGGRGDRSSARAVSERIVCFSRSQSYSGSSSRRSSIDLKIHQTSLDAAGVNAEHVEPSAAMLLLSASAAAADRRCGCGFVGRALPGVC